MNYYYYRENKNDVLVGPMSYPHAHAACMYLSKNKERSGTAEIVTILGTRPGDPIVQPRICVDRMYVRGRIVATGRVAQFYSDNQRPATW